MIDKTLYKISIWQTLAAFVFSFLGIGNNLQIEILLGGLCCAIYTMLLLFSSRNISFVFLGFPIRIGIVAIPIALLVHNFNLNLLGLFLGFVIGQIIYILAIWKDSKKIWK